MEDEWSMFLSNNSSMLQNAGLPTFAKPSGLMEVLNKKGEGKPEVKKREIYLEEVVDEDDEDEDTDDELVNENSGVDDLGMKRSLKKGNVKKNKETY